MLIPRDDEEHDWQEALHEHQGRHGSNSSRREQATPKESALANALLVDWANCDVTTPKVQYYANLAMHDILASGGKPSPNLVRLAQLGTYGKHPQNVRTELVRYLGSFLPEFTLTPVSLPLMVHKGIDCGVHSIPHFLILPHKIFAYI